MDYERRGEPGRQGLGIFISYRRADTSEAARLLYESLRRRRRSDRFFMDVDNLLLGRDWVEAIDEAVAGCDVLLVLIGPSWLSVQDDHGGRRLDDEQDRVRVEIATALQARDKAVIPVLLRDARMPRADELPPDLRPLVRREAIRIKHETFRSDVEQLVRSLKRLERANAGDVRESGRDERQAKVEEPSRIRRDDRSNELSPGSDFAGYRITSVIGRGRMGVVYLAEDLGLGRGVAIRVLPPELSGDPNFRARWLRESRLEASLDHPNVIPVYKAGEADGLLYLAMRYMVERDLRELLADEGRLEPRRAVYIVNQVASALEAAHAKGLIHRNLTPGNIRIGRGVGARGDEHVYVSGFGLTQLETSRRSLSHVGLLLGTIDYLAPEQVHGGPVDARSDIYALGCVLYELLTGQPPYQRDSEVALMAAHLLEPPPRPSALRPDLPVGLDEVITVAMAKRPEDRYPSSSAFAAAAHAAIVVQG